MPFDSNCGYYLQILYKNNVNPRFKFKSTDKLLEELEGLIIIYKKNLYHSLEFKK